VDFEDPLRRILAAIFDVREKPAVGSPPEFVREATDVIDGMASVDSLVLKRTAEYDLMNNAHIIEPEKVFSDLDAIGLSKQQILDSIEVLDSEGIFNVSNRIGGGAGRFGCLVRVTPSGLEKYCLAELDNYEQLKEQTAGLIVNEGVLHNQALAVKTGAQLRLIDHILHVFETNGLITTSKYLGGNIAIHTVHAKFRRILS
jgi:hypothetical protein